MKVRFCNEFIIAEDCHCTAKIHWRGRWPMWGGLFPSDHPASREAMKTFRDRGYWASCFPEGDGITFYSLDGPKDDEVVIKDIEECFGFIVEREQ